MAVSQRGPGGRSGERPSRYLISPTERKREKGPRHLLIPLFTSSHRSFFIFISFFFIPPPPAAARLPPPTVKPNLFNDNLFPPLPSHEAALSSWCWWGVWVWSASRWVGLCHLVVRLLWDYTLAETEAPTSPNPPFHTHTLLPYMCTSRLSRLQNISEFLVCSLLTRFELKLKKKKIQEKNWRICWCFYGRVGGVDL